MAYSQNFLKKQSNSNVILNNLLGYFRNSQTDTLQLSHNLLGWQSSNKFMWSLTLKIYIIIFLEKSNSSRCFWISIFSVTAILWLNYIFNSFLIPGDQKSLYKFTVKNSILLKLTLSKLCCSIISFIVVGCIREPAGQANT